MSKKIMEDAVYSTKFVAYSIGNILGLPRGNIGTYESHNNSEDGSKSNNNFEGGEKMTDLSRADGDLWNEVEDLQGALEDHDYSAAREATYRLGEELGMNQEALEGVEQDYDDLREATYAMINEVADGVQEANDVFEQNQQEYGELLDSLEALQNEAADIGVSDAHKRHREQDEEFISKYLEDMEE